EVGRPLLELSEILDAPQAPLGAVDVLPADAAETYRVQPDAALLGTDVRGDVKLSGRVAVDVAIQAGHPEARLGRLAVVGWVELLLRERRQQQAQAVELHRGQQILEQSVVVVNR